MKRPVIASEAKQSIFSFADRMDCFRLRAKRFGGLPALRSLRSKRRRVVAVAPLRKRFAFVAGNDGRTLHHDSGRDCDGSGGGGFIGGGGSRQAPAVRPAISQ